METNQINPGNSTDTLKPKKRIKRLTAEEVRDLPGANPVVEKLPEPELTYYLIFIFSVTGPIGNPTEATQVYGFANQLDTHARTTGIGVVMNVGVTNGLFEVVLKLTVVGEQSNHGIPATNAFKLLNGYLSAETLLKQGPAGKPAQWRAKVNGTTIVDGRY